jgi:hypothetical protein
MFKKIADAGLEYFQFEEDFIEKNVRCIPMIVRFKMDAAGIKLKLAEWSKFSVDERIELAIKPCNNRKETEEYRAYLANLVLKCTGQEVTYMTIEQFPIWANIELVPGLLNDKAKEFGWTITTAQWKSLTDLQRFALSKLYKSGHENKNFPKAVREFGLFK